MLRRSRISGTPDLTRISAGVQRPGIDPRINCSLAYALGESTIDPKHGHYVEVKLIPSELELTCRVTQDYAGKGFGNHDGLIHAGDELFVIIPEGDPALGPFVVKRAWSELYAPPALVANNPKDIVRVLETDINWRGKLQGKGIAELMMEASLHIKAPDDDVVALTKDGLELGVSPTDFMALASLVKAEISAVRDNLNALVTAFLAHMHPTAAVGPPSPPTPSVPPVQPPAPVNDVKSAFVKSK